MPEIRAAGGPPLAEIYAALWRCCRAAGDLYGPELRAVPFGAAAGALAPPPRPGGHRRARGSRRNCRCAGGIHRPEARALSAAASLCRPRPRFAPCPGALVPLPRPSFGCRAADALHRPALLAPTTGPSFGCRRCGWLYRARGSATGALVASTGPRYAPRLLPRPGASTAPLMRSTMRSTGPRLGCRPGGLHRPEVRAPCPGAPAPSTGPRFAPLLPSAAPELRAVRWCRCGATAPEARLPRCWRTPPRPGPAAAATGAFHRARSSRPGGLHGPSFGCRCAGGLHGPELPAVAAAPLAWEWRRVLASPPRFGRRTWRPPRVTEVRAVAAAVPEVCAALWRLRYA